VYLCVKEIKTPKGMALLLREGERGDQQGAGSHRAHHHHYDADARDGQRC